MIVSTIDHVCDNNRVEYLKKNGYVIYNCRKCQKRYAIISNPETHLNEIYSDKYFFDGKDGYPNYLEEKDLLTRYGNYYATLINKETSPGKMLDVGCAAGFILKGFVDAGWDGYGIEPNETMAKYGRQELNLNIFTGSLENYSDNSGFDLITLIQVIGHFYDLHSAMTNITKLSKPNGYILVESWDMGSLIARMMGKSWHEYSPPSVVNWFSSSSLTSMFQNYGFTLVDSGRPAKKINVKHALSLLEEKTPNIPLKKLLFEKLTSIAGQKTVTYPPFDLKWYLFRKG